MQALPLEAAIPDRSNPTKIGSASTPLNEKFTLLGRRVVGCPLSWLFGIFCSIPSISKSLRLKYLSVVCLRSASAKDRAVAVPTILATSSVPDRLSRS